MNGGSAMWRPYFVAHGVSWDLHDGVPYLCVATD